MLKGIFRKRPALPRYVVTYDASIVLNYLRTLPHWTDISLKLLTLRTTTLLALLTTQRCQSLSLLSLDHMDINPERIVFNIPSMLKNTSPRFHQQPITLSAFPQNEDICPIRTVVEYIKATARVRKSRHLIVSYTTFSSITPQTAGRYVKMTLSAAGINTKIFTSHTTRHASSSANKGAGVPLQTILQKGGWKSTHTFAKHYDLPIQL